MTLENHHASSDQPAKRTYQTPVLTVYGDVRQLTGGGMSTMTNDGGVGGPSTRAACWIAEVLYGIHSPRVTLVRAWLARCQARGDNWAVVIVPLYRLFGRHAAAVLRAIPALEPLFRPAFDRAVRSAHLEYSVDILARRAAV